MSICEKSQQTQTNKSEKMEGRFSRPSMPARIKQEKSTRKFYFIITLIPIILLVIIIIALVIRSWPILQKYPLKDLLFGEVWKPTKSLFGFLPFIAGTFWVTIVALVFAVPPSLFTAIYLSEYARKATQAVAKPMLDLLAAIPSVVYGVWGLIAIVPLIGTHLSPFLEKTLGFIPFFTSKNPTGYGILAGGIVLAVMIMPFIISITFEVLSVVPQDARQASLALGATRWHTIVHVVLPQVGPGIGAGVVLGASRAMGETMAVLMVVGNVAQIPHSIFDSAYPLSALIANNYGDMMSIPLYDAALMSVALMLLVIVLIFNLISTLVLRGFVRRP
jgi:phosphate transport system permease protein